ncbi:MAG: Fe-S cluster assembly protein SufD [Hyphomicrobium sp.]
MNVAIPKTKAEQALTEAFAASASKLPGGTAVKSARNDAIGAFSALGLPHRRIEEWKYTDLRVNFKDVAPPAIDDATAVSAEDVRAALGSVANVDVHAVVFVNGRHRKDLSTPGAMAGLEVQPLAGALTSGSDAVTEGLTTTTGPRSDATIALNTAFMTDGAVVRIANGATLDKPLMVVFVTAGPRAHLTSVRNVISAGDGSTATLIEAHVALQGAATGGQTNTLSEVTTGKGAALTHIKIAAGTNAAVHLANWNVSLGANAEYRGFQYTSGQALARNQIHTVYTGPGGKLDLSGAYLVRGNEHVDTTLVVDHAVPQCESRELFKGVLDDRGRGIFQGKIIVRPNAQKTDGKQMAQALMLSPDAEFDSKPELEIYADDVVCGHGTTSAELDGDLLFYCKSRGIPENEARALLIESFVGEALDKVEHDDLRAALSQYATVWLNAPRS